jgi:hypothetical protein
MSDLAKNLFNKLDRIPAAPNFVRYNFEDREKTLKAYVAFAKGMPTVSYVEGLKIAKDLVLGLISSDQANVAADRLRPSPSRSAIIDFIKAFCDYSEGRKYTATPAFSDFSTYFPIGRDLFIPVRPTLVAREDGLFKPIFVFGWKSVPLNVHQRRLLMTLLEDAIFSLTDFQDSDAEIVFLPEINGARVPEVWRRGDYDLLSHSEMKTQMETFLSARELAYPIIADWLKRTNPTASPSIAPSDSRQLPLNLSPRNPDVTE